MGNTNFRISKDVFILLDRCSKKTDIDMNILVDLTISSLLGSLSQHAVKPTKDQGSTAERTTPADVQVGCSDKMRDALRDYCYTLGVHPADLLRDAVFAMRKNLEHMGPVNARNFPSIRMTLFYLEQQGAA